MAADPGSHRVVVEPAGHVLDVRHGETLMQAAEQAGYRWPTLCHGDGSCSICFIEVLSGVDRLSPPNPAEVEALRFCNVAARCDGPVRLACQAGVLGSVVVRKRGVRKI